MTWWNLAETYLHNTKYELKIPREFCDLKLYLVPPAQRKTNAKQTKDHLKLPTDSWEYMH